MMRRTFLQSAAGTGLALAQADQESGAPAVPIRLGFDSYSVRSFGWEAMQLLDYAAGLKLDGIQISSLGDFAMIMVLADEAQDVQGWMEQVHRSVPQTPFGFLLPAEATPVVQPYLSQPGIYHLAGKSGALAYQSLRGGSGMPTEQIAQESAQYRLSLLIFVALPDNNLDGTPPHPTPKRRRTDKK